MMPSVEVDDGGDGSVVYPGEASEGHPWDVGGVSTWGRWTLEEWEITGIKADTAGGTQL